VKLDPSSALTPPNCGANVPRLERASDGRQELILPRSLASFPNRRARCAAVVVLKAETVFEFHNQPSYPKICHRARSGRRSSSCTGGPDSSSAPWVSLHGLLPHAYA